MIVIVTYSIYLLFCLAFTYWVGKNLFQSGRIFLLDSFNENEEKADSVNRLLLVGFYLVNFGLVSLFMAFGPKPKSPIEAFEYLAVKIGIVLVVLGGMHYFNMRNIAKMRSKALSKFAAEPN